MYNIKLTYLKKSSQWILDKPCGCDWISKANGVGGGGRKMLFKNAYWKMFIEKRLFIKKCLTKVSSKTYKLRNTGGGLFSITVLQLITNHFSQTSFHYPSSLFIKYRLNKLLLELRGKDFIIYKLVNKRTEVLAIATSNKAHIQYIQLI